VLFAVRAGLVIALLAVGVGANAQAPSLSDVPADITEPARGQLSRQHASLLQRRDSITTSVRAHNERCADVADGSLLEAQCAAAHRQLNEVIADYRAAVEAFNRAVTSAPRAKP